MTDIVLDALLEAVRFLVWHAETAKHSEREAIARKLDELIDQRTGRPFVTWTNLKAVGISTNSTKA